MLDTSGLQPGNYVSAHLRLLYFKAERQSNMIEKFTRNAIHCASTLRPGRPIFLASDASYATQYGPTYGQQINATVIIHTPNPNPIVHIDRPDGIAVEPVALPEGSTRPPTWYRPPSDYYYTFIDLYLLSLGGCSFYGKGGYGYWAALIGGVNLKCSYKERIKKGLPENPCKFQPSPPGGMLLDDNTIQVHNNQQRRPPPFLEPMV